MEAFYYANHTSQIFDSISTPGWQGVGALKLEAGNYIVFAKADIGVNASSYAAYPHGGGALRLTFGPAADIAYAAVRPESGDNIETVALMLAAETTKNTAAVLHFMAPYALRTVVNSVRLAALELDGLHIEEVGQDVDVENDEIRSQLSHLAMTEFTTAGLLSTLTRRRDED